MDLNLAVIAGTLSAPPGASAPSRVAPRLARYLVTVRSTEPRKRRVDVVPVVHLGPARYRDPATKSSTAATACGSSATVQRRFWNADRTGGAASLEIVAHHVQAFSDPGRGRSRKGRVRPPADSRSSLPSDEKGPGGIGHPARRRRRGCGGRRRRQRYRCRRSAPPSPRCAPRSGSSPRQPAGSSPSGPPAASRWSSTDMPRCRAAGSIPGQFGGGAERVSITYGGYTETIVGWGSVATPGALCRRSPRHIAELLVRFPWAEVVAPSIELRRGRVPGDSGLGRVPRPFASGHLRLEPRKLCDHPPRRRDPASGPVTMLHIPGSRQDTLHHIAERGARDLYEGELAAAISSSAVLTGDGIITPEDLSAPTRPITREPIRFAVDEWEIATNPPPAVGGVAASAMLSLRARPAVRRLDRRRDRSDGPDPARRARFPRRSPRRLRGTVRGNQ